MNTQQPSHDSRINICSLSDKEFERICDAVYGMCRLNLQNGKKELVQSRLNKRLRKLGMDSFSDYLRYIDEDPTNSEFQIMVDTLTTNVTHFFRESDHFDFLRDNVLKNVSSKTTRRFRVWCAGCSTGEEAFTLAIILRECIPELDVMDAKILATDISSRVIAAACASRFTEPRFKDMPAALKMKYFSRVSGHGSDSVYEARPELKHLLSFYRLNLMAPWPMRGLFDVIFCRNVMIYFDKKTQSELVSRFYDILRPGGTFIVGHSESLTGVAHRFRYIQPSVYTK
jgi:chemotaxis protein methyltransferase CheR